MGRVDYEVIREAFIAETFGLEAVLRAESSEGKDLLFDLDVIGFPAPDASRSAPVREIEAEANFRKKSLPDLLDHAKQSASLGAYIRGKAHLSDKLTYRAALFEQGQISRDYWSKLLNDEIKPSKEKLLRVAVLLQVSGEEAQELLAKAGYALSPTDLRDVVVSYCLREGHYDFVIIEQLLADHRIQSLFNDRRSS